MKSIKFSNKVYEKDFGVKAVGYDCHEVDSFFDEKMSLIIDKNNNEIAIYKQTEEGKVKPFKMIEVQK